jgi:hypothetical protein
LSEVRFCRTDSGLELYVYTVPPVGCKPNAYVVPRREAKMPEVKKTAKKVTKKKAPKAAKKK